MSNHSYIVNPRWLSIGGTRVSADIQRDPHARRWLVTIMLKRDSGEVPVQGQEVEARLLDERGKTLKVVQRASGPMLELSEEMSISVDVPFQFRDSGAALAQLLVTYQGQTVQFEVVAQGDPEQ